MVGQNVKRSTEEHIILSLSGLIAIVLTPFTVLRMINNDWLLATLDGFGTLAAIALFSYVYITQRTQLAARILALVCTCLMLLTVSLKGSEQLYWVYPSLTAIFFLLEPKKALLVSSASLLALAIMIWPQITPLTALKFYFSAMATLLFSYAFADRMRTQQAQLTQQAISDPLTGAHNRRAMDEKLVDLISFHRRHSDSQAAMIIMDLDRFKKVNDMHGHAVGDDVLVALITLIKENIRATDSVYRLGGEEFAVIAEHTSLDDALVLAEKLRQTVEHHVLMQRFNVTVSMGTAEYRAGETALQWLKRADTAMYQAKSGGRNKCCVAS